MSGAFLACRRGKRIMHSGRRISGRYANCTSRPIRCQYKNATLYNIVEDLTGVKVKERVPDEIITQADQIVNIDLPAEDLLERGRRTREQRRRFGSGHGRDQQSGTGSWPIAPKDGASGRAIECAMVCGLRPHTQ
jgi:hypothetical protein